MASPSSSSAAAVPAAQTIPDLIAPHVAGAGTVDYRIVIPTRGRWRPASEISSERKFNRESKPFILVKTLALLRKHAISPSKVTLWVADSEEEARYRAALQQDEYWAGADVGYQVGVPGIRSQRNHIALAYQENSYIVSLDDDVGDVLWKQYAGNRAKLVSLPEGSFEKLILHAYACLKKHNAFIWGLATTSTKNVQNMFIDGISTRNGEINGFLYGYINRHDRCLLPQLEDATEDAERSLRYFAKDKIMLRYRMYCCNTRCWMEQGGLQALMGSDDARKDAERRGASELHRIFPDQTLPPKEGKSEANLMVKFRAIGGFPLPTTTAAVLTAANELEKTTRDFESQTSRRSRSSSGIATTREDVSNTPTPSRSQQEIPDSPNPPRTTHSNREDDIDEGEDENSQFESVVSATLRKSERPEQIPQNEDELIRQAMEASRQNLVLTYNGEGAFSDHIERALQESKAEEERGRRLAVLLPRDAEQEHEHFLRAKRLSCLDLGLLDSDVCSPADKKQRVDGGDASTCSQLCQTDVQLLIDMGFSRKDAEKELATAHGHVEIALERLLSTGVDSEGIMVESQD